MSLLAFYALYLVILDFTRMFFFAGFKTEDACIYVKSSSY